MVEQVKAAYQNAKTAAQQGNWADYGRYLDQLEEAINQLGKTNTSQPTASDNTSDMEADPVSDNTTDETETV